MRYTCRLHTGCEFEVIPLTAIQIGHGKGQAFRMFRFQDGTHHLLGVTKRNYRHIHDRWHQQKSKPDCEYCEQPEPILLKEQPPTRPEPTATPTVESQSSFALALEKYNRESHERNN